MIEEEGL